MLLSSAHLPTMILDKTRVGKAVGEIAELAKQQFWIHLGNGYDNVITQFKTRKNVPRISHSEGMKGNRSRLKFFISVLGEIGDSNQQ